MLRQRSGLGSDPPCCPKGKSDSSDGSSALGGQQLDLPCVNSGDRSDDGQAQPDSSRPPRPRFVEPVETVENAISRFFRNAGTAVLELENHLERPWPDSNRDVLLRWTVAKRVLEEIPSQHSEKVAAAEDDQRLVSSIELERHPIAVLAPKSMDGVRQNGLDVDALSVRYPISLIEAAEEQKGLDYVLQAVGVRSAPSQRVTILV